MTPEIAIFLVGRQWMLRHRTPDGIVHSAFYPNRKQLCDLMPQILSDVRGDPPALPPIPHWPEPDETIDVRAPVTR